MIRIVTTFRVRPNTAKEFHVLAGELAEASRAEGGNLTYDLCVAGDDPTSFVALEIWRNDTVIEAYNTSTHFTTLVSRMVGLCAKPPSVVQYTEV